jgi:PKD repeat protein
VSYLWDFGDGGSTSTDADPMHVFTEDGQYTVTLTVSDAGGEMGVDTIEMDVGNHAPVVTILVPISGLIYQPGADVDFAAAAVDFEDGVLAGSELSWEITLHHCEIVLGSCHTHPYWQTTGDGGTFATDNQHGGGVEFLYHEIEVTATDTLGGATTANVLISPDTDADGLSDILEYFTFGTDPLDSDSDDDGTLDGAEDEDEDGCGNAAEIQTAPGSERFGGLRDPFNPWDYFNPTQDGVNRVDDVAAVVLRYGQDQGSTQYGPQYDRSQLADANPWQFGPPDGMIRVFEVTAAVRSYGHDCG